MIRGSGGTDNAELDDENLFFYRSGLDNHAGSYFRYSLCGRRLRLSSQRIA
jgi:hypothetical protein